MVTLDPFISPELLEPWCAHAAAAVRTLWLEAAAVGPLRPG